MASFSAPVSHFGENGHLGSTLSVYPDETAAALFRRKAGRPFHTGLILMDSLKRPGRPEPGLYQVHSFDGPGSLFRVYMSD